MVLTKYVMRNKKKKRENREKQTELAENVKGRYTPTRLGDHSYLVIFIISEITKKSLNTIIFTSKSLTNSKITNTSL